MVLPSPGKELVLAQWKPFLHVLRTAFSHQLTMETTANQRAKDGSAAAAKRSCCTCYTIYWTDIHTTRACTALLFQLGVKMIAARNHTMSDALSAAAAVHLSGDYSLANKKFNSKKSYSKPQKRFFPYHRAYWLRYCCIYKSVLATFGYWRCDAQIPVFTIFSMLLVWWNSVDAQTSTIIIISSSQVYSKWFTKKSVSILAQRENWVKLTFSFCFVNFHFHFQFRRLSLASDALLRDF